MKLFLLTIIQFLISSQLLGQTFFEADGKQIMTGSIIRTYNFSYSFGDSLTLFFVDSVVQYSNTQKSIVKTISYSDYNQKSEALIQIQYFGINGRDSISKHFKGDKPSMIYQNKYDNLGRIIYYSMKDFNADAAFDQSFKWFYDYRDSSIGEEKIEIQTIFYENDSGDKRFNFRVLNFYDSKNRKVKELRESEPNDPMSQITLYSYNDKDSLISEKVDGMEMIAAKGKHINTKCDVENEYSFGATDYYSVKQLIHQKLTDNKKYLITDKCENYFYTLISYDQQTKLTLVKRQPYWCEGTKVIFTATKILD
jgi:hypothetical protein